MLLATLLVFSGAIEVEDGPERVLAMDLVMSVPDPAVETLFNGSLADALANSTRAEVLTQGDIAQIVDIEAERAAMNCDAASCFSEIASALGARHVLYGTATKVEDTWILQLIYLDSVEGKALSRREVRGTNALELSERLKREVAEMVGGEPIEAPPPPQAAPFPVGLVAGGAAAVAGVALVVVGGLMMSSAETTFTDPAGELAARKEAPLFGWTGVALLSVGSIAAASGAGFMGWQLVE